MVVAGEFKDKSALSPTIIVVDPCLLESAIEVAVTVAVPIFNPVTFPFETVAIDESSTDHITDLSEAFEGDNLAVTFSVCPTTR